MKKGIHPEYKTLKVVMTDGTEFETRSTMAKKDGEVLKLDIDPSAHPAWTGVHKLSSNSGQLAKFKDKFKGFGIED